MKTQTRERTSSYGEHGLTLVDNFGVYLSKRKILKSLHGKQDLTVLDVGCGFDAQILASLLPYVEDGIGIDIKVSEKAKSINKLSFIEGDIEQVLHDLPDKKFDLILMISVLEHLWHPQDVLVQCFRLLKPGGVFLINVPTWRGKFFLEFSAFKLRTSPACEIDDHKMYYDKQALWPLLVQAGFKPRQIHLDYIKFGLNLFARVYMP
jgi:SAM-dependent methyltransferase